MPLGDTDETRSHIKELEVFTSVPLRIIVPGGMPIYRMVMSCCGYVCRTTWGRVQALLAHNAEQDRRGRKSWPASHTSPVSLRVLPQCPINLDTPFNIAVSPIPLASTGLSGSKAQGTEPSANCRSDWPCPTTHLSRYMTAVDEIKSVEVN